MRFPSFVIMPRLFSGTGIVASLLSFTRKSIFNFTAVRIYSTNKINIAPYLLNRTIPPEEVLSNLTPDDSERLKLLETEYRLMFDGGQRVPSVLTPKMKLELLCCNSLSSRVRLHEFLFKCERRKENRSLKKGNKAPPELRDSPPAGCDRIIRVIDPKHLRTHDETRIWAEMRCSASAQQLVFDFTHESEMRPQDQKNLASQMAYIMQTNRQMRPYPFHLWLCGLKPGTNQYSFMEQAFGINFEESKVKRLEDLPWTISPNHYSIEFPLNDQNRPVIYLSPNAHRVFEPGEWDHNAVYVIGAIVDKAVRKPITFARARRTGVECIRLPLERYFKWSSGSSKTLTLNCIHAVLATAKSTNGDWETALRSHIPRRLYERDNAPRGKLNKLFATL